jgi:hypothetical protein
MPLPAATTVCFAGTGGSSRSLRIAVTWAIGAYNSVLFGASRRSNTLASRSPPSMIGRQKCPKSRPFGMFINTVWTCMSMAPPDDTVISLNGLLQVFLVGRRATVVVADEIDAVQVQSVWVDSKSGHDQGLLP